MAIPIRGMDNVKDTETKVDPAIEQRIISLLRQIYQLLKANDVSFTEMSFLFDSLTKLAVQDIEKNKVNIPKFNTITEVKEDIIKPK